MPGHTGGRRPAFPRALHAVIRSAGRHTLNATVDVGILDLEGPVLVVGGMSLLAEKLRSRGLRGRSLPWAPGCAAEAIQDDVLGCYGSQALGSSMIVLGGWPDTSFADKCANAVLRIAT